MAHSPSPLTSGTVDVVPTVATATAEVRDAWRAVDRLIAQVMAVNADLANDLDNAVVHLDAAIRTEYVARLITAVYDHERAFPHGPPGVLLLSSDEQIAALPAGEQGTLLELCAGDADTARAIQRIVRRCGSEYLAWVASSGMLDWYEAQPSPPSIEEALAWVRAHMPADVRERIAAHVRAADARQD